MAVAAFAHGLRPSRLAFSLSKSPLEDLAALMEKSTRYIRADEAMQARKNIEERIGMGNKRKEPDYRGQDSFKAKQVNSSERASERRTHGRSFDDYMPLNMSRAQILEAERNRGWIKWPERIKSDPAKRDMSKFCEFHNDHGHTTEDCFSWRNVIQAQIQAGHLLCYVDEGKTKDAERRSRQNIVGMAHEKETLGVIHVISGGLAAGGTSSRSWNAENLRNYCQ